ncbi:MAG: amidohydrolase family protein [Melioribacteraceae bacterium]|nr:amidohydrolase family protein [Melioribacteraceae bacterium]
MNTKIWINGKIFTVNEKQPWAEAIVTEGKKIKYVGTNQEAKKFSGEQIDLGGKLVLPGLIDAHVHFMIGGLSLTQLDLGKVKK